MDKIEIKKIDPKRFNILAGHSRSPFAEDISEEIGWYANEDESILGLLLLDIVDDDYIAIVMIPDEGERFRAGSYIESFATHEATKNWLINTMKWLTGQGVKVDPQGDKPKGPDLFANITSEEKHHPYFTRLANDPAYVPAKETIKRLMPYFTDVDGNFVEQFQTTGFDSRLWELYLNTYLVEEKFIIKRIEESPDFMLEKDEIAVALEAVTVGRSEENPPKYFGTKANIKTSEEIRDALQGEMAIKFGSPLYSKLRKKYWELQHVQGHPLIFAIADFHDDQSMLWSSTALIHYLYGIQHNFHYDENYQLVIDPVIIETHEKGDKEIPSGYFFQPDSENVSAVLFSASGTISKFNRIGRQAGFYDPSIMMIREGTYYNHEPNASKPKQFKYEVNEKCEETWGEGLSLFHNPNALLPVSEDLFPSIAHHRLVDGLVESYLPDFHPFESTTLHIRIPETNT